MFNFFKKNTVLLPWVGRESIYNYIKRNLDKEGKLSSECEELPDSAEFYEDKSFRWVAGAMDGVMGHHGGTGEENVEVYRILKLIRKQVAKPNNAARRETYMAFMNDEILGYVDPLLDLLRNQSDLNFDVLYEEAKWFASEGAHRGVVKMGVALLGLFNCEQDEELLFTLGKSEEFTLYAAVAIQNGFSDPNEKLFGLAKSVHGWGKIHLVERLSADTDEIKDWLLKHGCSNSIMPEYLAYTCAVNGELDKALQRPDIDRELYEGAGVIISALIGGGPAEDIDDYHMSMPVVSNFLKHSSVHCSTLRDLLVVADIKYYLGQEDEIWKKRLGKGWNSGIRNECLEACNNIISEERWNGIVWSELKSQDSFRKYCAVRAARILEIDTWDRLYGELQSKPLDSGLYYELMRTDNLDRIKKLVAFAEENLPLKDIATGPGNESGIGPGFEAHGCLDFILQDMDKHEGVGEKLIFAGLKSTGIRNRNMALRVLEAWNRKSWPQGTEAILKELYDIEPDSDLKESIEAILKK